MNDSNVVKDGRRIWEYPIVMQVTRTWRRIQINCNCILQTLRQEVKQKMYNGSVIKMLRKEIKWNHIKCSIKTEGKEKANETNNKEY